MIFKVTRSLRSQRVTKILLVMKFTAMLVCLTALQVFAKNGDAQDVSLQLKNAPLRKVFKEIKKQTGYYFLYSVELLAQTDNVSLNMQKEPLQSALAKCLQGTGLTYSIVDKTIVIKRNPQASVAAVEAAQPEPPPFTVTGKVVDEEGNALENVSVVVKGSKKGVASGKDGSFAIQVPDGGGILIFSYVGFESMESGVSGQTALNIHLKKKEAKTEEVVVIGYGSVKKSDVTGSVSSIKAAELQNKQFTSVDQALQGRAAGVQVTNSDATPGARPNIRIRGTNSLGTSSEPLFVVDGYPSNEDVASINPNDIESIEVLKDASATAIYGSRGANGVILVTTKRGRNGKLAVNLESYYGQASVTKTLEVMNARQYAEYRNDVVKNIGAPTAKPFASPALLDYFSTHTTDWQAALFQKAPVSDVQLSMSGGDEKTKFLISGEWYKQEGIIPNTGFERGNLRFNFDRQVSDKLKIGLTSILGRTLQKNTLVNTAGGTEGGTVLNLLRLNPAVPVYDQNGAYTYGNTVIKDAASDPASVVDLLGNPVAYANRVTNDVYLNRGQISVFGEYEIIQGLKLKILFGGEYLNNWQNFYAPYDLFEQAQNTGTASRFNGYRTNWLNENNLTYTKNFGTRHSLTVLGGFSFQKFKYETNTALATGFFTNSFSYNNLGAGGAATVSSTASQNQLNSYYARINGKLWENLLLTATFRADGSSKFGKNNKFGYFPSTAAAYKLGNLSFIRQLKVFDDVKFRIGYGVTGNQEIPPYLSTFGYDLAGFFSPGVAPGALVFGSTRQIAVSASRPANPDLRWEQTSSFNTGLDLGLWSNKLLVTVDYYTKKTTDLLWSVALPATTGFTNAFKNLGSVQNKGLEISLSGSPIAANGFKWNAGLNIAFNKNKILSLGAEPFRLYGVSTTQPLIVRDNYVILKPGQEIGKFFLYDFDGIWQSQSEINKSAFNATYKNAQKPGYARYKDVNGDGTITPADRKIFEGSAYPKYVFGFTNTFSFRGVELNAFLQGQQGNKILNLNKYWMEYPPESNKSLSVLNRWHGEGTSNSIPAAGFESSRLLGQDFVEDGSYIRLKSLSLSYGLPGRWMQAAKLSSVRLYITGTNLFTITHYTGYDPEVNSYNSNLFLQGVDQGAYPVSRSVIFGAKIGF